MFPQYITNPGEYPPKAYPNRGEYFQMHNQQIKSNQMWFPASQNKISSYTKCGQSRPNVLSTYFGNACKPCLYSSVLTTCLQGPASVPSSISQNKRRGFTVNQSADNRRFNNTQNRNLCAAQTLVFVDVLVLSSQCP